ncbi:MAG TPA: hypothetical protein VEF34_14345 [Syntrophobacteraceae bacterium]|nr:hypothetical protein [Syntrophobacteraceae bacterium]
MHIFRRDKGGGGQVAGNVFGKNIFCDTWMAASANLGMEGVDLYGGTRRSSAIALREYLSPEGIRRLTDHETNKAFERYYMRDLEECRSAYALTRCNTYGRKSD